MIHEITVETAAILKGRGCPVSVLTGPEPTTTTTWGRERIVIEHDDDSTDSFSPVKGSFVNPAPVSIRNIAAKATIYAQSPSAGALEFEHRRRAEHVLDMLIVAFDNLSYTRKNRWDIKSGRFFKPDDLAKSEQAAGAAYELKFTWERGIRVLTWAGDKQPEATIGAGTLKSRTHVKLAHGPDDEEAETSCGDD